LKKPAWQSVDSNPFALGLLKRETSEEAGAQPAFFLGFSLKIQVEISPERLSYCIPGAAGATPTDMNPP
jgi:hypothetical protein